MNVLIYGSGGLLSLVLLVFGIVFFCIAVERSSTATRVEDALGTAIALATLLAALLVAGLTKWLAV